MRVPVISKELLDRLLPGLMLAVMIALAVRFVSEHLGGPAMLYALLFGMAFNFLCEDERFTGGIRFASRTLLRLGVALLGLRITVAEVADLGWPVVALVVAGVLVTILGGWAIGRACGLGNEHSVLSAGSVAICGASAALAISSILPEHKHRERNTILTVAAVTALSTVAMVVYPVFVTTLELDHQTAGVFLGATIHDVAQVVGAGYSISEEAGDTATVVKLLRVAMLVPIVLVLSLAFRNDETVGEGRQLPVPLFVIVFAALVFVGSAEWFPSGLKTVLLDLSRWCLIISISAIGMKTALKSLQDVGGQAVFIICAETVLLALFVLGFLLIPVQL